VMQSMSDGDPGDCQVDPTTGAITCDQSSD